MFVRLILSLKLNCALSMIASVRFALAKLLSFIYAFVKMAFVRFAFSKLISLSS